MLRFSVGTIPVTVRPTFWLVALLLGWGLGNQALLLVWVAIVFFSVLAHELGHAFAARRYGADVSITLTTFGGFTRWSINRGMSPGRRALVAAAGSAVGIVVGLAMLGLFLLTRPWPPVVGTIITLVVWVNVGWGVLNWLPIRPLDGGHLVLALLDMFVPRHAERVATALFLVTGLAALGAAIYFELFFAAALAAFMTWGELSRWIPSTGAAEPIEFSYDQRPEPRFDPPTDAAREETGPSGPASEEPERPD